MKERTLEHLIDKAKHREDLVAQELARLSRELQQQEKQLEELQRYSHEYERPLAGVINPADLKNRLAFREQLDQVVNSQSRALAVSRLSCQQGRVQFMDACRDTKVLESLAEKYQQAKRLVANRHEQNQLDEVAARMRNRPAIDDESESC